MKHNKMILLVVTAAGLLIVGGLVSTLWSSVAAQMMGEGGQSNNPMRGMMQQMMGDRLPPGMDPALLPEPKSAGAQRVVQYCVQCHDLPGPGMHTAKEWPEVVARMNSRMQMMSGMGETMMGKIAAPTKHELVVLTAYLEKHAQRPIDPGMYSDLSSPAGQTFSSTCAQCHALPDPKQHTAQEWPGVVQRMKSHASAMGKIVPDKIATRDIIGFLSRHGQNGKK